MNLNRRIVALARTLEPEHAFNAGVGMAAGIIGTTAAGLIRRKLPSHVGLLGAGAIGAGAGALAEKLAAMRKKKQEARKPGKSFNALQPRMIKFNRARNGDGEFAPQGAEGGPDPATMTAAYGHPVERAKMAVAFGGGAGAALLGMRLRSRLRGR